MQAARPPFHVPGGLRGRSTSEPGGLSRVPAREWDVRPKEDWLAVCFLFHRYIAIQIRDPRTLKQREPRREALCNLAENNRDFIETEDHSK